MTAHVARWLWWVARWLWWVVAEWKPRTTAYIAVLVTLIAVVEFTRIL